MPAEGELGARRRDARPPEPKGGRLSGPGRLGAVKRQGEGEPQCSAPHCSHGDPSAESGTPPGPQSPLGCLEKHPVAENLRPRATRRGARLRAGRGRLRVSPGPRPAGGGHHPVTLGSQSGVAIAVPRRIPPGAGLVPSNGAHAQQGAWSGDQHLTGHPRAGLGVGAHPHAAPGPRLSPCGHQLHPLGTLHLSPTPGGPLGLCAPPPCWAPHTGTGLLGALVEPREAPAAGKGQALPLHLPADLPVTVSPGRTPSAGQFAASGLAQPEATATGEDPSPPCEGRALRGGSSRHPASRGITGPLTPALPRPQLLDRTVAGNE